MKKLLLILLCLCNLSISAQIRNCGTMEHLEFLQSQDPMLEQRMQKNEYSLQQKIHNQPESFSSTIITIPVVVHVVYYTSTENISTAQVQSQIDVLNEDFRRLNADAINTPSAFQSLAADSEIEFCLASIDPNGNSTTGITRTSTSQSSFSTNDGVKYSSSGGVDAWNTSEYMNIWVCDISGGILGYAQFPGGNSSSDGIVCDYAYFGNTGTATSPFNLGRTATHEVGHYLNLRHIWGDSNCGNDYCNDTPEHSGSNYGCPNYPSTSNCSGNGSNGDMFMNYMDYTDDACMNMFSQDQKTRMIASINTSRSGLITSNGCQGSGLGCTDPSAFNYDPLATTDDGSCCYVAGCTDPTANNYNSSACYDDGSCTFPVYGCTDPIATNFDPLATIDDGSCCYGDQLVITITTDNYPVETSWQLVNQSGTVAQSISAGDLTQANTSSTWSICPSSLDCYDFTIYDVYGDGICCSWGNGSYTLTYNGVVVSSGGSFAASETTSSIGSCIVPVVGCMNSNATNYDPLANTSIAFGGIVDPNNGAGAYFNGDQHLIFNANVESKIVSAVVYASISNTITFELRDNNSSVIDDTTITITAGGQRLYFDFDVPVGNDYQLGVSAVNSGLYRNNDQANVNYPYDISGLIQITESSATISDQYYYFFYDIEVEAVCTGITNAVYGCTDPTACNYDPLANTDDGSCLADYGCTDLLATNYDASATCDDGNCFYGMPGCTDPTACNYNPSATIDDGSCLTAYGCMDVTAFNYDSTATCSDPLSCIAIVYGCTDPTSINYDATATTDDGTCIAFVYGCTDVTACNYYAGANIDDGSCEWTSCNPTTCGASPITGLGVTDIIQNRATFIFDDMNTYDALGAQICRVDQLRIQYKELGTSSWSQKNMGSPTGYDPITGICNSTTNTAKLVLGLISATTYEWRMKVWYCGVGNSGWVSGPNFTTLGDCPNVGNLTVTSPTTSKATFTWDDSNGAYSFVRLQARVDTVGSSFFNIGGVGVNYGAFTKNKNGLVPGESYRAKSRTWCDPNGGAYKAPSWTSFIYWTQPSVVRLANPELTERNLLRITDLLGREINHKTVTDKTILLYIYDEGTVEKRTILDY
ncbi:zinc metalloprotease [Flavobacteriales bacterium]|nr:zinc metalloprotease [Flavobacteriales bacterium]